LGVAVNQLPPVPGVMLTVQGTPLPWLLLGVTVSDVLGVLATG
jgi:hypothetical protein